MQYKVSVIVPIYGIENFIRRCAISLFEQTLDNVEFIFVDDASQDNSVRVLEDCIGEYSNRKDDIRIIRHKTNRGLPSARNSGLAVASGQYIFHCDGDDFVEPDMLKRLYETGVEEAADIVWCDWFLSFKSNERYMHQQKFDTAHDFLCGMLSGSIKYNVWNKLIKKDLYDKTGITFPDGHPMGEDMTIIRLAACAQNVAYIPEAFYHYVRYNSGSYTKNQSEKNLCDIRYNVNETITFLQSLKREWSIENEISYFKLDIKFPFLISDKKADYRLWKEWYPEANAFIWQNKRVSLRRKVLQFMAWKNQFWYVWLYYFLFMRIIYGVIFR